jgi:hypothetical protein
VNENHPSPPNADENKLRESLQAKYDFYFQEVREHPGVSHLLVGLADACLALSKRKEALLYYKKALALDPADEKVVRQLQSNFSAEELKGVEIYHPAVPFWRQPGKVVSYPLKEHGLYTLIFAAFAGAMFGSVPVVGDVLTLFFLLPMIVPFLFAVLQSSGRGETKIADWPSFADLWDHYIRPDILVLISAGVAFGPIVVYGILASYLHIRLPFLKIVGLVTGVLYLPMALIAAAVSEKPLVPFQFRTILAGIWKIRGSYLILLLSAGLVIVIHGLILRFLPYSIFFLGLALFWLVTVYFGIVLMRILGNTYATNRDRIKWRQ